MTDPAYRQRFDELCRRARNYVREVDDEPQYVIDLCAAVEELALDLGAAQPTLLRANDLRLRLLAACPESAEKIDAVFKAITIPCGPMFERERLERERDTVRAELAEERAAGKRLADMAAALTEDASRAERARDEARAAAFNEAAATCDQVAADLFNDRHDAMAGAEACARALRALASRST